MNAATATTTATDSNANTKIDFVKFFTLYQRYLFLIYPLSLPWTS